jgi:hypothetical protein
MHCSARRKATGKPCGNHAVKGATVCRMHGASSPQARAKAAERVAEARAARALADLQQVPAPLADPLGTAPPWRAGEHGRVRWTGPDQVVVDVISLRGKDGVTKQWYWVRRNGRFVGNYPSLEALAEVVDVASLVEADDR